MKTFKKMDTATVLAIIEIIDTRYKEYNDLYEEMVLLPLSLTSGAAEYAGRCNALHELRNHLDSFIEAQLSIAENSTGE